MAVEHPEPDPAGRRVADDTVVHAYDADAGEAAHTFTRGYSVRADMPWREAAPRERCPECARLVDRRA